MHLTGPQIGSYATTRLGTQSTGPLHDKACIAQSCSTQEASTQEPAVDKLTIQEQKQREVRVAVDVKSIHPAGWQAQYHSCQWKEHTASHCALTIPHAARLHDRVGCVSSETCSQGTCADTSSQLPSLEPTPALQCIPVDSAHQPAVAIAQPTMRKSMSTAERTVRMECHNS